MYRYIRRLEEVGFNDVPLVGGKNASLGEMIRQLKSYGINVPPGFVVTADAYEELIGQGDTREQLEKTLAGLDKSDITALTKVGERARSIVRKAGIPKPIADEIVGAYRELEWLYGEMPAVAVRSSATAEDLPDASFAGQQQTFLNVTGEVDLIDACLNCFASLFTDRAISYRVDKQFDHMAVRLSAGVQLMVRSDLASAGVIFTIDPQTGFQDVVLITSAYGLGENVVAGRLDPDEILVFKPTLDSAPSPLIRKKCGSKHVRMILTSHGTQRTKNVDTPEEMRRQMSLSDDEALQLARWAVRIERHYSQSYRRPTPMDIEWAKDGNTGELFIVQARPETVHAGNVRSRLSTYRLVERSEPILTGRSVGESIATGRTRVVRSAQELHSF